VVILDDIVQEALIRLSMLLRANDATDRREITEGLVASTCYHYLLDYFRRETRHNQLRVDISLANAIPYDATFHRELEYQELQKALEAAVYKLSPVSRRVPNALERTQRR